MSRSNFMIEIANSERTEPRFITVFAEDEDHARSMGEVAADSMREDFHNGREFYVELVTALE
ncbi:hypothetical protein CNR34_00060 [Pseudomonas phage nickie]|uniref:Uncharacterized protein n=1 Tax=Pseudomonas phage nickie TaxID=2048977 RepID=A0A2H4P723_9CAUD|nr:hypothetical protein FDJ16_gp105 [Pseudomonas phage nickie]ATW57993.1 hypothetical protein CNR34_00060 [Pseudomonas phage nickie]